MQVTKASWYGKSWSLERVSGYRTSGDSSWLQIWRVVCVVRECKIEEEAKAGGDERLRRGEVRGDYSSSCMVM